MVTLKDTFSADEMQNKEKYHGLSATHTEIFEQGGSLQRLRQLNQTSNEALEDLKTTLESRIDLN